MREVQLHVKTYRDTFCTLLGDTKLKGAAKHFSRIRKDPDLGAHAVFAGLPVNGHNSAYLTSQVV